MKLVALQLDEACSEEVCALEENLIHVKELVANRKVEIENIHALARSRRRTVDAAMDEQQDRLLTTLNMELKSICNRYYLASLILQLLSKKLQCPLLFF